MNTVFNLKYAKLDGFHMCLVKANLYLKDFPQGVKMILIYFPTKRLNSDPLTYIISDSPYWWSDLQQDLLCNNYENEYELSISNAGLETLNHNP